MQCKKHVAGCTDQAAINYNAEANDDDGSCIVLGEATFWIAGISGVINITIEGTTEIITEYYPDFSPICGSQGCATFNLLPGIYSYTAVVQGSTMTLTGSIEIPNNGCILTELTF